MAKDTLPRRWTVANEAIDTVDAGPIVLAGLGGALVDVGGAKRPGETQGAVANCLLADFPTSGAVETGVGGAGVVDFFAGRAGEALGARAPVLIRCRVLAGPAVLARLVSAAVIEVLVAKDPAPISVADTLPA